MTNSRDDFSQKVKDILGNRVGWRCSNPDCRKPTRGANTEPNSITNIGVAAHICAAALGGPRYNVTMTTDERKSIENGIWLCQSCSKLIDSDVNRYNVQLIKTWKMTAEQLALAELESLSISNTNTGKELLKFYIECFDRPAFRSPIREEGSLEDFDKAIEDTLIALNTGILRTRDGMIIKTSEGKSAIENEHWRDLLDTIADMLVALRKRLKIAKSTNMFSNNGEWYYFKDHELERWFDQTREEISKILSIICDEANIPCLKFPRRPYRW